MHTRIIPLLLALLILGACAPIAAEVPTATPPPPAPPTAAAALPTPASADPSPIPIRPAEGAVSTPGVAPTTDAPASASPADLSEIAAIDAAPRPARDQVSLAQALGPCRPEPTACPRVARVDPLDVRVGEVRDFFITDFSDDSQISIQAELRYAGPVVLIYVEQGVAYDQAALEEAARAFEQEIYPRNREIFGSEVQPGVDGDLRITILNARDLSGQVLGYFSSQDSLPRQVNRFSNEREMFFMNIDALRFSDPEYLNVLAHEFQHMIHQNEQPNAATWFNEGNSELAEDLNGFFASNFIPAYLFNPDTQLTGWSGGGSAGAHYGAAHLFMRYIYAQYAGEAQLRPLVRADAGDNLGAFVALAQRTRPDVASFGQLVADWATANLIDDRTVGDGRYTYETGHGLPGLLPQTVDPVRIDAELASDVAQFGADYLRLPEGATRLEFQGDTTVGLAGAMPRGRFAWWGGRSDDSVATLTRPLDLRGLGGATLLFDAWHEIENDYDYAFVSVSADGGATWETLPGTLTTDRDPQGGNYGHALTGVSGDPDAEAGETTRGRWVEERMDLSAYAGREVLLRFWQINDQALNFAGLLIDNIRVPELGFSDDAEAGAGGWQAEGFVRVDGDLPQLWELRLVRRAAGGGLSVAPLAVDAEGRASADLDPDDTYALVVVGATPHTSERAGYKLSAR